MGRVIRDVSQQRRCQRWLLLSNGSSFDHVVQFAHSEYRKVSTSCIFDRIPIQLILIKISPTILRIRITLMSPECRSLLSIFFAIRLQLSSKIQFPYSISSSHVTSLFPRCSFCLNTIECVRYRYIVCANTAQRLHRIISRKLKPASPAGNVTGRRMQCACAQLIFVTSPTAADD